MALTADQITAQNFKDFFTQILPYLNKGNGGTSDTPLGQVAFFDDLVAPYGWLVADGTVYNIADYPDLATQYERVHGSKNFYGGDGTTTFAVPNWQGEFLRASGTNSHTNQGNGAAVGVHQNATEIPRMGISNTTLMFKSNSVYTNVHEQASSDSVLNSNSSGTIKNSTTTMTEGSTAVTTDMFTTRPTNTSLLLCIKAVPSSEMNTYSLTERRVGTWIDGKPLYETTVDGTGYTLPNESTVNIATNIRNVDKVIKLEGICHIPGNNAFKNIPHVQDNNTNMFATVQYNTSNNQIQLFARNGNLSVANVVCFVVQYTKTTD